MNRWHLLIGIAVVFIFSYFRPTWLNPPDFPYLKHLFEHSQWRLPLSTRIMSDEKLYQYAGQYIIQTNDLFSVNPEVPPLAKYMYGWSALLTDNPYWITPILYIGVLLCFYWLARRLYPDRNMTGWLTLTLAITPLFFSQLYQTMLDLPQLFFLMLHLVGLWQIRVTASTKSRVMFTVLAGLALGCMAATKVPILAPVVGTLSAWYLWRAKQWRLIPGLVAISVATYTLTFIMYFLGGHSFIDWLRTQAWMIHFYRQGQVDANHLMLFVSVTTGWYRGWWDQPWQRIVEWSSFWPMTLVAPLATLYLVVRRRWHLSLNGQYLLLLFLLQLIVNFALPFWPRYYLLLFPFGLLLLPQILSQLSPRGQRLTMIGLTLLISVEFIVFLRPMPTHTLQLAASSWQKGNYLDLYEFLSPVSQSDMSRIDFHRSLKKIELATTAPQLEFDQPFVWPWQQQTKVPFQIRYQTSVGDVTHQSVLTLTRQGQRWLIDWTWDNALPEYSAEAQVIFLPAYPYYGQLSTYDGTVVSLDGTNPHLAVIPNEITADIALPRLAQATGLDKNYIESKLFVDAVGDWLLPLADLQTTEPEVITVLQKTPGVYLIPTPGRVMSPLVFNYQALEWERGLELAHPELNGQLGGQLLLLKPNTEPAILLHKSAINGQDVVIEKTAQELFYNQVPR